MSRRVIAISTTSALIAPLLALSMASSSNRADAEMPTQPSIETEAELPPSAGGDVPGGGVSDGPAGACTVLWTLGPFTEDQLSGPMLASHDSNGEVAALNRETIQAGREVAAASPDGQATLVARNCGGPSSMDWVAGSAPLVTVDDIWPGALDRARRLIPWPVLEVAPPAVQGTLVNAPLWLAVQPPEPVSARAQVGAVWAQVDARFIGLTWNMGNGHLVECDGPGDIWSGPSPDADWVTPECGYNYEQPSTPEFTGSDDYAYNITVTAHWQVRLTGSDGRDLEIDPIDISSEFDYVVWELQTIGHP